MNYDDLLGLGFFSFLMSFIVVFAIIGLIIYIVKSLALSKMAKKLNLDNPWMAWIPVVNLFLMGKIAGDSVSIFGKEVRNLSIVLLVGSIVSSIVFGIPLAGVLVFIAYTILYYSTLNKIFRVFNDNSGTTFTILSIVFAPLLPIFLMICSSKEPDLNIFNEGGPSTSYNFDNIDETEYEDYEESNEYEEYEEDEESGEAEEAEETEESGEAGEAEEDDEGDNNLF